MIKSILYCVTFTLLGFLQTASTTQAQTRVMSFNIRYGTASDGSNHWDKRKEWLVETIQAFQPDLLGTQETLGFQREFIASKLSGYEAFGVGREDGKEKGEQTALFFRSERFEKLDGGHFWLSDTPDVVGSRGWDAALPRMVSWEKLRDRKQPSDRPLLFANTHFDHQGQEARASSATLIRSKLAELGTDCDIVLNGDFNADEGSKPYQNLFATKPDATPFTDTFRAANPKKGEHEGTFSGFKSDNISGARIDWIAIHGNLMVKEASIDRTAKDGRTPSDHFPVTAILQRP